MKTVEPLLVSKVDARLMLRCGHARLEQLIAEGELQIVPEGKREKVVVDSLNQYIERHKTSRD